MKLTLFGCMHLLLSSVLLSMEEQTYSITKPLLLRHNGSHTIDLWGDYKSINNYKEKFSATMQKALPSEIWLYIATFLAGNDPALLFILSLITVDESQALELIKHYRGCSNKNPIAFFAKIPKQHNLHTIKEAYDTLNKRLDEIENYIKSNDLSLLEGYFKQELESDSLFTQNSDLLTLSQKNRSIEKIEYLLHCISRFELFIRDSHNKTICLNNMVPSDSAFQMICITTTFTLIAYLVLGNFILINTHKENINQCVNASNSTDCADTYPLPVQNIVLINSTWVIVPLLLLYWKYYLKRPTISNENTRNLLKAYKAYLLNYKITVEEKLSL
jgi:hypothetical protein